jgi:predicted TIM-barrel fold metal-dependent hydrolase
MNEKAGQRYDWAGAGPALGDFHGNKPRTSSELCAWHAQASAPEIVEPSLPIVDAHHHLYGTTKERNFYRLEDLREDLDSGHRIVGTVYVEAYQSGWRTSGPQALRPVGETEMIVKSTPATVHTPAGDCQVAAAIVCHADLSLGDAVEDVLNQHLAAAHGRLRGVRQRAATVAGPLGRIAPEPRRPHLLCEPAFLRGFARLASLGLSFDTWIYHTQLQELLAVADRFPETTIVLDHVGGPLGVLDFRQKRGDVLYDWERDLHEVAARPNVCVKVGGMGMAMLGFGFEQRERPPDAALLARAWKPYIEICATAFGTHRCMFESNFPIDKQSCSYVELWNAFKLATSGWSPRERSDLFYRTACQAYHLPALQTYCDNEFA